MACDAAAGRSSTDGGVAPSIRMADRDGGIARRAPGSGDHRQIGPRREVRC
jgi:hypothetical protein